MSRVNIVLKDLDAGYKSVSCSDESVEIEVGDPGPASTRSSSVVEDVELFNSAVLRLYGEILYILRACMDERQASSFSDRTGAVFLLNYQYCSHYLDLHLKLAVEAINQSKSFVS